MIWYMIAVFGVASLSMSGCDHTASLDSGNKASFADTVPSLRDARYKRSLAGHFSDQSRLRFDSNEIGRFLEAYSDFQEFGPYLRRFYRKRSHAYAWFDREGRIETSMELYSRVLQLADEGVPVHVPHMDAFRWMMEGSDSMAAKLEADPQAEIMMTAQYLHFAKDAWRGLTDAQIRESEWFVPRKRVGYDALLDSLTNEDGTVGSIQEPVHQQYRQLKGYLKKLRAIASVGGWDMTATKKTRMALGDSGRVVANIRRKIYLLGDLESDSGSEVFDKDLSEGVRSFQRRFGLLQDGVVGASVLRALNVPIADRIRQVVVNMERARWLATEPMAREIVVNIPQFEMMVFEEGRLQWSCPVVVGKDANRTAIFQSRLRYIVFSPYWNVPASILQKEILPAIARNPDFLRQNNMEWYGSRVRQRPGPDNALGRVKFLFPNSFNMYLHDTPGKSLFSMEKRAFSHGCIRIAEPRKLALYLLREEPGWDEGKVDAAMNGGVEKYVTLNKPVPVTIIYMTCWADGQGEVHFREDIYRRDQRLMDMIFVKK